MIIKILSASLKIFVMRIIVANWVYVDVQCNLAKGARYSIVTRKKTRVIVVLHTHKPNSKFIHYIIQRNGNLNFFSILQVFVYTRQVYERIRERLKSRGVAELSSLELSNYFSPWYAEHMGAIQSASGNRSVEAWAVERLRVQYYIFTYASLLRLHGDAGLLKQLDGVLGNEALLQLQLRTLAPLFKVIIYLYRSNLRFNQMLKAIVSNATRFFFLRTPSVASGSSRWLTITSSCGRSTCEQYIIYVYFVRNATRISAPARV